MKVKVTQSCLILCNPMDYTVHGILQARIQEWVAFFFSRWSSQTRNQTQVSHISGNPLQAEPQGKTKERNQKRNKQISRNKWQWKHDNSKPMGCSKSSSKREVYSNTILPQETRETSNRQPKFTPKTTGKIKTKKCQN